MTTYVYQTIPQKDGDESRYYEIKQSMKDAPLTKHPETGEPIRRVLVGGLGILGAKHSHTDSCGCAPGGCCN